jgi:hypothetical protein
MNDLIKFSNFGSSEGAKFREPISSSKNVRLNVTVSSVRWRYSTNKGFAWKVTEFAEMIARRFNMHGRAMVMISTDIQELISKQEHLTSRELTACIKNSKDGAFVLSACRLVY